MRRFPLVRPVRESLRDNQIHPLSDWGSSGRRFKSCQPDRRKYGLICNDVIVTLLNDAKLGTIWGPQVPREQFPGVGEGLPVGM